MMMRLAAFLLTLALWTASAGAAETIKPTVTAAAAESSHVACTTSCFLRSVYVTSGAVAGYVMTFNADSAPADGAVTWTANGTGASGRVDCIVLPANSTVSLDFGDTANNFPEGLTLVFSSTGCFTKTASATAFFSVRKQ